MQRNVYSGANEVVNSSLNNVGGDSTNTVITCVSDAAAVWRSALHEHEEEQAGGEGSAAGRVGDLRRFR